MRFSDNIKTTLANNGEYLAYGAIHEALQKPIECAILFKIFRNDGAFRKSRPEAFPLAMGGRPRIQAAIDAQCHTILFEMLA